MDGRDLLNLLIASNGHSASSPISSSSELDSDSESDSIALACSGAGTVKEPFREQEIRMRVIIGKLAQISAAIKKSGSKYRNQRADAALTDEKREELEAHFRFILVIGLRESEPLGNSLTTEELVQKVTCIEELTTVQKRLIHANILRQNRVVMASPEEVPEENYADERLRFAAPRFYNPAEMTGPGKKDILDSIQVSSIPSHGVAASLNTRTATSVGSKLDVEPIVQKATPSVTTKVTQTGEMQDYPQRPKAEGDRMVQCPYCADLLSPEDLKTDRRWR